MADLSLPDDYQDLLVALNAAGAEFVLVGGWRGEATMAS